MMDLKEMKLKLMEAQKPKSNFKLSERTVVDIIMKIIDRKKVNLIHSISGREYVTDEKIINEIEQEVKKNKGRIKITDLTKLLDLPNLVINEKINKLLKIDQNLSLIEGNLINSNYLNQMCLEINQLLFLSGSLQISEISSKFGLSIDYFKNFLKLNIGTNIKAEFHGTRLLTDQYIESQLSKLKPVLISATFPVSLKFLVDTYKIDDFIIEENLNKLLNQKLVKGRLISGFFEPQIYYDCQKSYIIGNLSQNGFLEYSKLNNIGIKDVKEFLKSIDSTQLGLFLADHFIGENMIINFEGIFFSNFQKHLITDTTQIFDFELNDDEILSILNHLKISNEKIILINQNIVPKSKLNLIIDALSLTIKEEAASQYNLYVTKKNERESKKKSEMEQQKAEESKDDKKNKKKNEKDKKKKGNKNEKDGEESIEIYLQISEQIKNKFSEKISNLPIIREDEVNQKEDTFQKLYNDHLFPLIESKYSIYIKEFMEAKTNPTSDPRSNLNQIEYNYHCLQIMQKSLELMGKISSDVVYIGALSSLIEEICKKELTSFFISLLTYQLIHNKFKIDVNKLNSSEERQAIIEQLKDNELINIYSTLNNNISKNSLSEFMSFLNKNIKNVAISLSVIDKKKEKVIIERIYYEFKQKVDEKLIFLGKADKKRFNELLIDITQFALIKTNIYLNIGYDIGMTSIYQKLIVNSTLISNEIQSLLINLYNFSQLKDEEFNEKQNEINEITQKLLTQI